MKTNTIKPAIKPDGFNAQAFLDSTGLSRRIVEYRKSQKIYSQGETANNVFYIQKGGVKLSVVNQVGKEAVVAILETGDFFGEGCLAGQNVRMGTATTVTPTTLHVIEKREMIRVLHAEHAFSDRFVTYMLARNIRIEEDLIDQRKSKNGLKKWSAKCPRRRWRKWSGRRARELIFS